MKPPVFVTSPVTLADDVITLSQSVKVQRKKSGINRHRCDFSADASQPKRRRAVQKRAMRVSPCCHDYSSTMLAVSQLNHLKKKLMYSKEMSSRTGPTVSREPGVNNTDEDWLQRRPQRLRQGDETHRVHDWCEARAFKTPNTEHLTVLRYICKDFHHIQTQYSLFLVFLNFLRTNLNTLASSSSRLRYSNGGEGFCSSPIAFLRVWMTGRQKNGDKAHEQKSYNYWRIKSWRISPPKHKPNLHELVFFTGCEFHAKNCPKKSQILNDQTVHLSFNPKLNKGTF